MGTDSYDEMHRFLTSDESSHQLLAGRLSAHDAPAPLRGVAALFEAAAGPAVPQELARRSQVVAAATAEVLSSQPQLPSIPSRRKAMLSKVLTAKFAAAATAAAFGLGTAAAAATGSLPGQTQNANTHATTGLATAAANQISHGHGLGQSGQSGHGANSGDTTGSGGSASVPSTGPANQHAQVGLCTAYLAAHGSSTSSLPQDHSTAFKALIAQHGSGTSSYCQGIVKQHNTTGDSSDATELPDAGKPANPGKSSTTPTAPAKPASAGSSQSHAPVSAPNNGAVTGSAANHGSNATGAATSGTASRGASTAGSGNATTHP